MTESTPITRVAAVAIGRNEGERLVLCLESLLSVVSKVIYVDSGSTDDSVAAAKRLGAEVVELDLSLPFTAARARNAGFERLVDTGTEVDYVQFVDGDCLVQPTWLTAGAEFLDANPSFAVACGRRRERFPEASIYNQLCDLEWATPVGEAQSCGGDALIRTDAFKQVGGYNPTVIAGEEPEMCVRLRQAGWKIMRLDEEMTLHDAAMTRFGQWWKRATRAGYAYALGFAMHGTPPEKHWRRESLRIWFWAFGIPLLTIFATMILGAGGLALLLLYPVSWLKTLFNQTRQGHAWTIGMVWASACVIGKFPELAGQLRYWFNRLTGQTNVIIEYKSAG